MAVDAAVTLVSPFLGGFLAKTAGTVSITDADGTTVLDAFPVAAGIYHPLPMNLAGQRNTTGAVVTLGGGASGTLLKA